jgi:hypothetical protein
MYIKGISKVLIVSFFLISLFLFTPQRVEASTFAPPGSCPNGKEITSDTAASTVCCPNEATWRDIIIREDKTDDIKEITNVGKSYILITSIFCAVKFDIKTNNNTTKSDILWQTPSSPIEYNCPVNTCSDRTIRFFDHNQTICYPQGEENPVLGVCCVENEDQMGSFKPFDPTSACKQAVIKSPVRKGQQALAPVINLAARKADEICKEDALVISPNGVRSINKDVLDKCTECLNKNKSKNGVTEIVYQWTALGCINTGSQGSSLVGFIMQIFYGVAFVFILIKFIIAGIQLQSGDPEAIKEAKETFVAGFSALFIAGFGLILLRYIGFDILGIGSFLGLQFPEVKP